jgi:hypothetical protein
LIQKRNQRRRVLQREVLPRVVFHKNPSEPSLIGNRQLQPCIQFLNVDATHAVRLFTPPFETGPLPVPITIFCVAIATEDGCFLSGLNRRFELGHLYPANATESLTERSPICMCTDLMQNQRSQIADDSNRPYVKKYDSSSNSDESSSDMGLDTIDSDSGMKCTCQFNNKLDGSEDESEEDQPLRIYRGRRGPGSWHCYVAVFDGDSSIIRIDGIDEPLSVNRRSSHSFNPTLDGFTIGSDHAFDMSLCFGQGSDGEGEGAMSELVSFKGKLDIQDIQVLERHLMVKHGIPSPVVSEADIAQEDHWTRQAHALLSNAPHNELFSSETQRIPLRHMARHRLVAWRQSNAVTGESVKVQKIGSRYGDSSSDW